MNGNAAIEQPAPNALRDQNMARLLRLNHDIKKSLVLEKDINPVTIIAVGDQSHGKSSVIEALSHVDLPRGEGMKTKLPLALHLRRLDDKNENGYALISYEAASPEDNKKSKPNEERIELSEISAKVDEVTEKIAGPGCVIKDVEISLTVFEHSLENLTLYDLPGLVRNVDDENTIASIISMYDRYMANPNAVLLNVINATIDLETVDTLARSKAIDPMGKRTVVCFTKIDKENDLPGLVSKIKDAPSKFPNINPGSIFCVRNRTQNENDKGTTLEQARAKEASFFRSRSEFSELPASCKGIGALSTRLVQLQGTLIRTTVPVMEKKIKERQAEQRKLLETLPHYPRQLTESYPIVQQGVRSVIKEVAGERKGISTSLSIPITKDNCIKISETLSYGDICPKSYSKVLGGRKWTIVIQRSLFSPQQYITGIDLTVSWEKSTDEEFGNPRANISLWAKDSQKKALAKIYDPEKDMPPGKAFRYQLRWKNANVNHAHFLSAIYVRPNEKKRQSAVFKAKKDILKKQAVDLYPEQRLLSMEFFMMMQGKYEAVAGGLGLPGTVSPEVEINMLTSMVNEALPMMKDFAYDFIDEMKRLMIAKVDEEFEQYPSFNKHLKELVSRYYKSQGESIEKQLNLMKECETEIDTENNYYGLKRAELCKKLNTEESTDAASDEPEDIFDLEYKNLPAFAQRVVEKMIDITSYWTIAIAQITDSTVKLVRLKAFSEKAELGLLTLIEKEIYSLGDELVNLMAPRAADREKREECEERIAKLEVAEKMITDMVGIIRKLGA